MKLLIALLILFLSGQVPDFSKTEGFITSEELSVVIEDATGLNFVREPRDRIYRLVDIETFELFLGHDDTDKLTYIIDWRDCDDFAKLLWARVIEWMPGLPFGVVHIDNGSHVANIFVDSDLRVWFIDAQHDRIYEAYDAEFIYM